MTQSSTTRGGGFHTNKSVALPALALVDVSRTNRCIIIVIFIFICTFWILPIFYLPPPNDVNGPVSLSLASSSSSSSSLRRKPLRPILSLEEEKQETTNEEEQTCPKYGCPIYPAEMTPYLNELLTNMYIEKTEDHEFDFGSKTFALLTQKGKSHIYNQDRSVLIQPYNTSVTAPIYTTTSSSSSSSSSSFLLGVFDGHGVEGHIVADLVARDLPERLAEMLNRIDNNNNNNDNNIDKEIIEAMKQTFKDVDINGTPNFLLGGCTATVTLRRDNKLYIANTGDSQTIIVSVPSKYVGDKDPEIVFMTRKDKAKIPEEYDRITKLGGWVNINEKTNDSRVFVYSRTARDTIGLAMSRSIGDWEWKPVGVIADPIVDVYDINANKNRQLFLIAASDGIWDVRRREFYAKQFVDTFYRGNVQPPLQKVWEIIQTVTPKATTGYRDDITLIVSKL